MLPGDSEDEILLARGHRAETSWLTFWRNKYWLTVEALPIVLGAVGVRLLLEYTSADFAATASPASLGGTRGGYIAIGDISSVLSGGIFLIGFMLNGVIADYKEAEKLPGELSVCLACIEDGLAWGVPLKAKGDERYTAAAVRTDLLRLVNVIFKWLGTPTEKRNDDVVHTALSNFWFKVRGRGPAEGKAARRTRPSPQRARSLPPHRDSFIRISAPQYANQMYDCGPPVAVHPTQMITRLRLAIYRISIIAASTYLPAGYAVVEAFCILALSLVIVGKYSSQASGYGVIIGTAVLYGGMLRLLRDIDNPFEYQPIPETVVVHSQSGSTEIDLGCLLDYRRLLSERIANDPHGRAILTRNLSRRTMSALVVPAADSEEAVKVA